MNYRTCWDDVNGGAWTDVVQHNHYEPGHAVGTTVTTLQQMVDRVHAMQAHPELSAGQVAALWAATSPRVTESAWGFMDPADKAALDSLARVEAVASPLRLVSGVLGLEPAVALRPAPEMPDIALMTRWSWRIFCCSISGISGSSEQVG